MRVLQLADSVRFPRMSTEELRKTFLLDDLFQPDRIALVYVDLDRTLIGSAVPATTEIVLPCPSELRATSFTERRELGIFNIGGAGTVQVDDVQYSLAGKDALYVGKGDHRITFRSDTSEQPAEFYLLSYPAHAVYPTSLVKSGEVAPVSLGSPETANERKISKLIYQDGAQSCQLVMGFTELAKGSVWNTLPAHTHMRRSEIYLYFNVAEEHRVMHLMGPPQETRHLIVANKQAVISPLWSIHAGAGTSNYSFCWGMGGENQVYSDMDPVAISELL